MLEKEKRQLLERGLLLKHRENMRRLKVSGARSKRALISAAIYYWNLYGSSTKHIERY